MLCRRSQRAYLQGDFYRDQYRRTLRWLVVMVLVMFLLMLSIFYLVLFRPTPVYYVNTTEGRILAMPEGRLGGQ